MAALSTTMSRQGGRPFHHHGLPRPGRPLQLAPLLFNGAASAWMLLAREGAIRVQGRFLIIFKK